MSILKDCISMFHDFWGYNLMSVSGGNITPGKVFIALVFASAGLKLSRVLSERIGRRVFSRFGMSAGETASLQTLVFYVLATVTLFSALEVVHFPLGIFTMLGGVLAIGVGFGSQNVVNNFISGLILLFEKPVRVGDIIQVGEGMRGKVTRIGARSTMILMADQAELLVPNSTLLEKSVINWTLTNSQSRFQMRVRVTFDSDINQALEILAKIATAHPKIEVSPEPQVVISEFSEIGVVLDLFYWCQITERVNQGKVHTEIHTKVLEEFRVSGIKIAVHNQSAISELKAAKV